MRVNEGGDHYSPGVEDLIPSGCKLFVEFMKILLRFCRKNMDYRKTGLTLTMKVTTNFRLQRGIC